MNTPETRASAMKSVMNVDASLKPRRQKNWDWRAAGNFICGGSGSGLLLWSAFMSGTTPLFPVLAALGLASIALGLLCVWMEIGRPLRAMNVFLHAQTSWMTREALVAPPLFLCGALAAWTGAPLWIWLTGLLALLFLYCQARIVYAAKGIPAWRAAQAVPLLATTGASEGAGLLLVAMAWSGDLAHVNWMTAALVPLLIARALLWRSYRNELAARHAPRGALKALDAIEPAFVKVCHWVAAALALLSLAIASAWLAAIAGLLAAAGGWLFKYTLIVKASFNQGYALPHVPVRGAGAAAG